jgi:hypothetical protein
MDGARVIGIEFNFLGHVLLFDKDAAAERPRLLHTRAIAADLYNAERRRSVHRISTSARLSHRQTVPRRVESNPQTAPRACALNPLESR